MSASVNTCFSPDDFVFFSPHKSFIARGQIATLTTCAEFGHYLTGEFQQQVRWLFNRVQRDTGTENPILAGAIPFDKRQPCFLFVPQSCEWVDRESFTCQADPLKVAGEAVFYPEHDKFCSMVTDALHLLGNGILDKVVLSRLMRIKTFHRLNSLLLWQQLNLQNPASYNFHIPLHNGTLIGASPELLLRKQDNQIQSCPLAGTASRSEDPDRDNRNRNNLLVCSKDRQEHLLVTETMRRRLEPRCRVLTVSEPSLLSTPATWHLATRIHGIVNDPQDNALSVACLLHPTPALCGIPYVRATEVINQLEPFDRGWFAGIAGWCDARGNGEWVVTIRCARVQPYEIDLFAGAGIIAASQPESEWNETNIKLNTMLRALGFPVNKSNDHDRI